MSKAVKYEGFIPAWNRWLDLYKTPKWNERRVNNVPLTVRGYTEFTMSNLSQTEQKKIVKGIERGFVSATNPTWVKCMHMIAKHEGIEVGYLGKSQADLPFPDRETAEKARKLMEAQLTMTGDFKPRHLWLRDRRIYIHLYTGLNQSNFTNLSIVVSELYEPGAAKREAVARKIQEPDYVIRIPFDSNTGD